MLAEECLLSDSSDGTVQLMVTPRTLSRALEDAGEGVRSPDEAEADFVKAVAGVYHERVLGSSKRLGALKSADGADVPFGVGFLALSVLAAFHMRTDDEHTGRAFYPRLANMLGCELIRSQPAGFEGEAFLELWAELSSWLKAHYNRQLAVPNSGGLQKYIAFPFAHVPLRQVDLERLPQFFDAYDYEPGTRAPVDRLAQDLFGRAGPWRYFTEAGQRALSDPNRRSFVVRQVAHELQRWDGCLIDSSGTRRSSIEVWLDFRRRRAELHLLARRPKGFPDVFSDGELVFESSQEGWYAPVPLSSEDDQLLEQGIRIGASDSSGRYLLQLRAASVFPLTPSEDYTGFVSDRVLRAHTQCAVMCTESLADKVGGFLTALTHARLTPRQGDSIPKGWCLFTDVRPTNGSSPPAGLERLGVEATVGLIAEGGLRLGRRWTWLEGAPGRLIVSGSQLKQPIKIDGQLVASKADGQIDGELLKSAGHHIVEIGNRLRQRVTVLAGSVSPDCTRWPEDLEFSLPVALPPGPWTLVGRNAGEYETVHAPAEGGLSRPSFRIDWAIRVSAGRGATALHLHDNRAPITSSEQTSQAAALHRRPRSTDHITRHWAEVIYQAGIRRPLLLCAYGCGTDKLSADWRTTVERARALKRRMRVQRR